MIFRIFVQGNFIGVAVGLSEVQLGDFWRTRSAGRSCINLVPKLKLVI